jgi:hypothetical protein
MPPHGWRPYLQHDARGGRKPPDLAGVPGVKREASQDGDTSGIEDSHRAATVLVREARF